MTPRSKELYTKYLELCHTIQSGIKWMIQFKPSIIEEKHLRVGLDLRNADQESLRSLLTQKRIDINLEAINHGALVDLLVKKGIFTDEEYFEKLVEFAQREVDNYQKELDEIYGGIVKLGGKP